MSGIPDALGSAMTPENHSLGIALGGGGPAGVVYEIGALRALEESIDGLDLTHARSYVGVSAGSFVAAALANGLTPRRLLRMLFRHLPGEEPFDPAAFFRPAYREWARRGATLPRLMLGALWGIAGRRRGQTVGEHLLPLARALPMGIFDNEPIRRYVHRLFSARGRTDDFRALARKGRRLTVVATDIEAGQTAPFGQPGWDDVPISRAIQASTAVPGVYLPVEIQGRHYVDGALLKTVHSSVACQDGARFVLVINPLVPVRSPQRGAVLDEGLPATMHQTLRTLLHSRLEVSLGALRDRYPGTDIVLLEPDRNDHELFFAQEFSFASREVVAERAYQITRQQLLARRKELVPILARHGMRLRLDVLRDAKRDLWLGAGLRPSKRTAPVAQSLTQALDRLERLAG
jgi:predicted acylesterase/phospholipase RssA